MYDLRLQFVRGVQKAGQELGILKQASEEEDNLRAGSVAQAMQEEDMPVPGEDELAGAAEVLQALNNLEAEGSPAEAAAADDAAEAVAQVQELLQQDAMPGEPPKEAVAAAMDGSKQPVTEQTPHADSHLEAVNENQDEGSKGSTSTVEGGEVGKQEGNAPPKGPETPHADSNLEATNEDQNSSDRGSAGSNPSPLAGGEVGDDKSEKSAGIGLFGTLETQEILNRLRTT
jgi:hypothetical protein